jgi:hemolysin III
MNSKLNTEHTTDHWFNPKALLAKPRARGWIHLIATPLVLMAAMFAITVPETFTQRLSVAVFGVCSVVLFGSSAVYHRGTWSARVSAVLRRLDHSNIFLLIAGTYTPLAVLLLPTDQTQVLLTVIWVAAIAGILVRQLWSSAPRWLYVLLYIALGWVAVWYLPDFYLASGGWVVAFIVLGGVFYTLGAVIYALKRPNWFPYSFGFHEIFHVCTVIAWTCHYVAIILAM